MGTAFSNDMVRFLPDGPGGTAVRIPAAELAGGVVCATVEGEPEPVYIQAGPGHVNTVPFHDQFPGPVRAAVRRFEFVFRDVYAKTAEEWEFGFRCDRHPWRELSLWDVPIAEGYARFTAHLAGRDPVTAAKKGDVFRAVLNMVSAHNFQAFMATSRAASLTNKTLVAIAEMRTDAALWKRRDAATLRYRNLIDPEGEL